MDMTTLDNVSPASIRAAILTVRTTKGRRIRTGYDALDRVMLAPNQTLRHSELLKEFGALNSHLGWFCREVVEQLGISNAGAYPLFDRSKDATGATVLKLKAPVFAALTS